MRVKRYLYHGSLLIGYLLLCYGLAGCRGYEDATAHLDPQVLAVPKGDYAAAAWLDQDRLAFLYEPHGYISSDPREYRIVLYSRATGELSDVPAPAQPEECFSGWIEGQLERLPDGRLGFVYRCNIEPIGAKHALYSWNPQFNELEIVHTYPNPFAAGSYSFAPDMSELVQERAVGPGLNNELYHVRAGTQLTELLPHFQRAKSPSWSPDGTQIAFFGTESYPDGDPGAFFQWGQIEELLLYPWDLYVMAPDASEQEVVVSKIFQPAFVKWSPQGDRLAFGGEYKGVAGLWILQLDTMQLTRIWHTRTSFDWSPDGMQMVVLDFEDQGDKRRTYPVVIDLPLDRR